MREYKEAHHDKNSPVGRSPGKSDIQPGQVPDELLANLMGAYPEIINDENLKQLGQFLIPKPEGRRFVVKGNADMLQTVVDKVAPLIHATRRRKTK